MKEFLVRCFSDINGEPSSTRILSALVICTILGVWSFLCLRKNEFIPIGYDNLLIISSCIGMKIYQRKVEGEQNNECKMASDNP